MFVRLAILISLAALGLPLAGDDAMEKCEVGPHGGYLVSVAYAEKHHGDILATLPDEPQVDGFWKVSEQIAIVADRNLRERLENGIEHDYILTQLFPDLAEGKDASQPESLGYQREELKAIVGHFGNYHRQFVGLMIDGHEVVLLNYAMGPRLDPSEGFICIHRVFEPGKMHFLQARFNWDFKLLTNVSMYGSWQDSTH